LTPGVSSTVHIYTQTVHRTTQLTTLVEILSGIRTQNGQTKINDELNRVKIIANHINLLRHTNIGIRIGEVCKMVTS
jgi:hypothetical protein